MKVATNPHLVVDHVGRPCGACPIDPRDPRYYDPAKPKNPEVRGWVGARLESGPKLLRKGLEKGDASDPSDRHDITFEFRREPFDIPDTRFYRDRIKEGALLAADEATARICGVTFVPVERARERARRRHSGERRLAAWI